MSDATAFFDGYRDAVAREHLRKAAFDLHQTVENLYQGLLLVLTFYTPYDHNILFLRDMAEQLDRPLYVVWPSGTRAERADRQSVVQGKSRSVRVCLGGRLTLT